MRAPTTFTRSLRAVARSEFVCFLCVWLPLLLVKSVTLLTSCVCVCDLLLFFTGGVLDEHASADDVYNNTNTNTDAAAITITTTAAAAAAIKHGVAISFL